MTACFVTGTDTDANYKRMLLSALEPETIAAVRLGVASHNLFDVAHTLGLLSRTEIDTGVHFEVLAGMAGPLSRALLHLGQDVLVYSPAVAEEHLHSAVAYLVRRLDEPVDRHVAFNVVGSVDQRRHVV